MSKMSELFEAKKSIEVLEQVPMNAVVPQQQKSVVSFTSEKINLIKNTIAKEATDLELQLFIEQCKRTGLDPITRQIYFIKNPKDGKVQIQTSIDGFRLIAERSGDYQGQTPPEWCGSDGKWVDVWLSKTPPSASRVGVWKKNFKEPLYAIALFDEYAQKKHDGSLSFMWGKMPALMIAKVAESLALRKAFPNDLSGLYTSEEMSQSEIVEFEQPKAVSQGVWAETKKIVTDRGAGVFHSDESQGVGIGNDASANSDFAGRTGNDPAYDSGPHEFTGQPEFDSFRISFGKFKDKKLTEISPQDLLGYYNYLNKQIIESGKPAGAKVEEFLTIVESYLNLKK